MASAANWTEGVVPGANDVTTNYYGGILTTSVPVHFKSMTEAGDKTFDNCNVTLDDNFNPYNSNYTFTFTGGEWNLGGSFSAVWGKGYKYYFAGTKITCKGIYGGYGSTSELHFTDGCEVHNTGELRVQFNNGKNNKLEVSGGSKLTVDGGFMNSYSADKSNNVEVVGTGSCLTLNGNAWLLYKGSEATFRVADNAVVEVNSDAFIGGDASSSNSVMIIENGGKLVVNKKSLYINPRWTGYNNGLFIGDGGILEGGIVGVGCIYGNESSYGGQCSWLTVSNGIYRALFPCVGIFSNCSNCAFRVIGRNSKMEFTGFRGIEIFGNGQYGLFEIDDAAVTNNYITASFNGSCQAGFKGHHRMILKNNAEYYTEKGLEICCINYWCPSNRLEVLSGSRLFAKTGLTSYGVWNGFVVSNGVMETEGNFVLCGQSQSTQGKTYGSSNNWVRVMGSSPRIIAGESFDVSRQSRLEIVLPSEGYAEGVTPIVASNIVIAAGTTLQVEGFEERAENLKTSERIVLAQSTENISCNADVLAAANENIPEHCSVYLSADKKQLMCKVYKDSGTIITLR